MSEQKMTEQQDALYQRISDFSFDEGEVGMSFADRLALENGWTAEFAQAAMAEYKKFVFLAMEAGHPVTPSDQVDQVWHLHLVYTKSYWDRFCKGVLLRELHHHPTEGGEAESAKFREQYQNTLDSYKTFFSKAARKDLWPKSSVRFRYGLNFERVNTRRMWVLSKSRVFWKAALVFLGLALMTFLIFRIKAGLISAESSMKSWLVENGLAIVLVVGLLLILAVNIKWSLGGKRSKRRWGSGGCGDSDGGCGDGGCGGCGD